MGNSYNKFECIRMITTTISKRMQLIKYVEYNSSQSRPKPFVSQLFISKETNTINAKHNDLMHSYTTHKQTVCI